MQNRVRRVFSALVTFLALGLIQAAGPPPALAATTSLFVDNSAPLCNAAAFPTLAAALAAAPAANVRITVCPGTYPTAPLTVSGKTNFKLIGKKGAVLTPNAPAYAGNLLFVTGSSGVTIQRLTIDGLGSIANTSIYTAISFQQTSGIISKNTIKNWHIAGYPLSRIATGIQVIGVAGEAVKISGNVLPDIDLTGIAISGNAVVSMTGNKITDPAGAGYANAITLGYGVTGKVAGNKLTGNGFPLGGASFNGITLTAVSGMIFKGNTITRATTGIVIAGGMPATNNNTISGNKLYEVNTGIYLSSTGSFTNAVADGNQITRNKIINKTAQGLVGIVVTSSGNTLPPLATGSAQNEIVTRNTILHFADGVIHTQNFLGTTTGVFDPNKWKP